MYCRDACSEFGAVWRAFWNVQGVYQERNLVGGAPTVGWTQ